MKTLEELVEIDRKKDEEIERFSKELFASNSALSIYEGFYNGYEPDLEIYTGKETK